MNCISDSRDGLIARRRSPRSALECAAQILGQREHATMRGAVIVPEGRVELATRENAVELGYAQRRQIDDIACCQESSFRAERRDECAIVVTKVNTRWRERRTVAWSAKIMRPYLLESRTSIA